MAGETESMCSVIGHKPAESQTQAYFDASGTHSDSRDLCLGGYIFSGTSASEFDRDWRQMLQKYNIPYFHMKECAHATGVFKGLGHEGCDRAAREAIELIKRHAAQGIGLSVDRSIAPQLRINSPWKNEYSFIVGQVFFALRDWTSMDPKRGEVACLFESGDDGQSHALSAAQEILNVPALKEKFCVSSFGWSAQNEETHLQAADMLAWHLNHWCSKRRKGIAKRRGDFRSLLEVPMVYHHWDSSAVNFLFSLRRSQQR